MIDAEKAEVTTFKERVQEYWAWYATHAARFFETIEAGECPSLADEVSEFMQRKMPHMAWVFGPGESGGHSFTLSGEGSVPKQLLAKYWLENAKELSGWTFYASRQASSQDDLAHYEIRIGEEDCISADEFLIQTSVDDERQRIDLVCWHPKLVLLPDEHHIQVVFLLLDEALGEFGTQTWIGTIDVQNIEDSEPHVRRLPDLPTFIRHVDQYHKWKKLPPPEAYSVYQLHEHTDTPRGDTVSGSSIVPSVIFEYISNNGHLEEDPLEGLGAELCYLAFPSSLLPEGEEAHARGRIEDALDAQLQTNKSGYVVGGAIGFEQTYIDMLLLDGSHSRAIVDAVLRDLQIDASIHKMN